MSSPAENPASNVTKRVDHLDEDYVTCGDLKFALISFVAKDGKQRLESGDRIGLKIRGAFATRDEANAHVKRLMKSDNLFDIYVVDMYKWILLPPPDADAIDTEYNENYLNQMMGEYKSSQIEAKAHFEERKRMAMEKGIDSVLTPEERLPPPESTTLPPLDAPLDAPSAIPDIQAASAHPAEP